MICGKLSQRVCANCVSLYRFSKSDNNLMVLMLISIVLLNFYKLRAQKKKFRENNVAEFHIFVHKLIKVMISRENCN